MQYTDNYSLKKPEKGVEPHANIDDLNHNFDVIDRALADDRQISLLMYESSATYNTGDIVGYENPTTHRIRAYKCLDDNVTGQWDSTKWAQTTLAAEIGQGGGGSSTFAGLSDVSFSNLANGQVPQYNSTSGKWENANPTGGASDLSDLDDVSITSPSDGDVLEYDNGDWVNKTPTPVSREVEGNPIEIIDGANAPLVKCVSAITGSQDLHGYDKPWVGGAGKNKIEMVVDGIKTINSGTGTWSGNSYTINGVTFTILTDSANNVIGIKVDGTATDEIVFRLDNYPVLPSGTYTYSGYVENNQSIRLRFKDSNGFFALNSSNITATRETEANAIVKTIVVPSGAVASNIVFTPMVCLSNASNPTTFEPYSNICPITAYTEGEIEVVGHNIWDEQWEVGSINKDTGANATSSGDGIRSKNYIPVQPSTEYHIIQSGENSGNLVVYFYAKDKSFVIYTGQSAYQNGYNGVLGKFTTPSNVEFVRFRTAGTYGQTYNDDIALNYPSNINNYSPYTSTTHTTTFPSAIYRGSEDLVKGEVTSEQKLFTNDGTGWAIASNDVFYLDNQISDGAVGATGSDANVVCNMYLSGYVGVNTTVALNNPKKLCTQLVNGKMRLMVYDDTFIRDSQSNSLQAFVDFLAQTNIQVAYELTTPTTSSVTPTNFPIKSLNGYSHIESSTGDMEIEYITGKYNPIIEIAERKTKTIDEMLTDNIESSMVASQNYTTGELIIACGKIYRATANIASGSSLTVGTNVVKTTIEAEIARSGGGVTYSTTEHVVGTWIDGSTVYEKTFSFSIPSNNYTTETTGITNFDKCVGYSGIVALGNGYYEDINYGRPDSSNSTYYIAITTTGDIFFKTYEASSGTAYITMRYTKSS